MTKYPKHHIMDTMKINGKTFYRYKRYSTNSLTKIKDTQKQLKSYGFNVRIIRGMFDQYYLFTNPETKTHNSGKMR